MDYGHTHSDSSPKKRQGPKIGASIGIGIAVLGVIFAISNGIVEINQDNLDQSLQNMPQSIQDASSIAKEFAQDTGVILQETIDTQLDDVQIESVDIPVDTIKNITQIIHESNPVTEQPVIDKLKLERKVHDLTNQYREQNGLETLAWDESLANVARSHSQDMSLRNYFSHNTLEGKAPTDRAEAQEYFCKKTVGNLIYSGIAENIFQNNLYDRVWYINDIPTSYDWNDLDDLATSTVDGWMDSPGHRKNILNSIYDKEGIGVEISSDDKVYITQNFC